MSGTNFVDKNTVITADYMNTVDRAIFDAIGDGSSAPSNSTTVKVNLNLDNVDNTSDLNKPISTAQAAGLVGKDSQTGAAHIPTGTTAQRPVSPTYGDQRANSTIGKMEWWNGSNWVPTGGGATGGGSDSVFIENGQTVTTDYTITSGNNAGTFGPVTIASGVTVTIPSGSVWSIV